MSGSWEPKALEAAHIDRYLGKDSHHIQNGLLLRADIHTLFDQDLIRICPDDLTIQVAEEVEDQTYRQFHGRRLNLPDDEDLWPSKEALRNRLSK